MVHNAMLADVDLKYVHISIEWEARSAMAGSNRNCNQMYIHLRWQCPALGCLQSGKVGGACICVNMPSMHSCACVSYRCTVCLASG